MRHSRFKLFFCLTLLFVATPALAGFIEIGGSGNFRRQNIDTNAYDESSAITASFSYIFNEASALEFSYTDGRSKRMIGEGGATWHSTVMYYKTVGLDFVYTFGERGSSLRPYLKAGVNQILSKRIVDQYQSNNVLQPATIIEDHPGLVPSAGVGFKLGLTERLSLKLGVDAWTSRPMNETPVTIDYMGRGGLSFLF